MTILFLTNHFNTGGITSYVMTLAEAFTTSSHKVIVASSGGDMVSALAPIGAQHVCFPFNIKSEIHPSLFWHTPSFTRFVTRTGVDIMHSQTRVTQMAAALASRSAGVPYVSTCHGFFKPHLGRRLFPMWGSKVIAISRPVNQHLVTDLATTENKTVLIPNGINLTRFTPVDDQLKKSLRGKYGLDQGPYIGMIARLSDVKGHRYLIEAMPKVLSHFPSVKCLFFGQGPLEADLKDQVAALSLGKSVLFFPVVGRTAEVLPLFDIFIAPSVQEGLGLSVLEAAAMEVPCVASRVGGLVDVVDDHRTGILVDPQNVQALANGVLELLSDPLQARSMGQMARDRVRSHFSAEHMAERTLAVYKDVLENHV